MAWHCLCVNKTRDGGFFMERSNHFISKHQTGIEMSVLQTSQRSRQSRGGIPIDPHGWGTVLSRLRKCRGQSLIAVPQPKGGDRLPVRARSRRRSANSVAKPERSSFSGYCWRRNPSFAMRVAPVPCFVAYDRDRRHGVLRHNAKEPGNQSRLVD
jgi:hypothetical protein